MARIFSPSFIILLLVFQQKSCTGEPLLFTAIGLVSGVMGIYDFIWGKDDHQTVIQQFYNYDIYREIYKMEKSITDVTSHITQSIDESNTKQSLREYLSQIAYEVSVIERWHKQMLHLNRTKSKKEAQEQIPKAKTLILDQEGGSPFHLNKIYSLFLNFKTMKLLGSLTKGFKNTCSSDNSLQSVQQIYLKLYTLVTLAEVKTYQTVLMAVELIRKFEPGSSYQHAVKQVKKNIIHKQKRIGRKFKHSLKVSSREVWRCDPNHHIEDKTYIQLKNTFRKFYPDKYKECYELYCGCKDYRSKWCDFREEQEVREMRSCKGGHQDCDYTYFSNFKLNDSEILDICEPTSGSDYGEKRYKNTYHNGNQETCMGLNQTQFNVTTTQCDVCTCMCEDRSGYGSKIRDPYFHLKPVFSNIHKNRVVTGARLVKKNNHFVIEIQEGTLGPMATIVNRSVAWVSNDAPFARDYNYFFTAQVHWGSGFTLADVEADEGSVVVGIQFGIRSKIGDSITLILHTRAFDFETGKLFQVETAKQFYASEDLDIENLDIPTSAPGKNVALTEKNKRIYLTSTGMKQDFGQTIVPFFDIQEVTTTIPTPMSGVGLYYKRYEGYGGFLGLKLLTYDFLKHFNSKISKEVD